VSDNGHEFFLRHDGKMPGTVATGAGAWCDDEPVASTGEQAFRMMIETIVTIINPKFPR